MQTPIKSKFNTTKSKWQVVKRTPKGAWEVLSNQTYESEQTADAMVDWYLKVYPLSYCRSASNQQQVTSNK
ncbi:hypothetical protein [Mangrovibacterium sp.]|uniref:hypothetical protein n=1 Tax=Mangrovibacterium sp. TaxID=1961364 RepID=UPI003565D662